MSSLQHPPCPSVPSGLNKSLSDFGSKPINDVINYLDERIRTLEEKASADEVLRAKYPALDEMYKEYETMKNLIATYE